MVTLLIVSVNGPAKTDGIRAEGNACDKLTACGNRTKLGGIVDLLISHPAVHEKREPILRESFYRFISIGDHDLRLHIVDGNQECDQ